MTLDWLQSARFLSGLACAVVLAVFLPNCTDEALDRLLLPGGGERPVVLATSPADGSLGISPNTETWVLFNMPMDNQKTQDAFRLIGQGGSVSGSFLWQGNRMEFHPATPYNTGEYTMIVGRASESGAGVDLGEEVTVRFSPGFDHERPRLVSSSPVAGATAVNANTTLELNFSEDIDSATIGDGLTLSPTVNYTISQIPANRITLIPTSPLPNGTYVVRLNTDLADPSGNQLAGEEVISFTVGSDFASPVLLSAQAGVVPLVNGQFVAGVDRSAPIVLGFSEPMDRLSVEQAFSLYPPALVSYNWNLASDALTLSFTGGLQPEENYELQVDSSAADLQQNTTGQNYAFSFRTDGASSQRPRVLDLRQLQSSAPGLDQSTPVCCGPALTDLQPLDVLQEVDSDPVPLSTRFVYALRLTFSASMLRNSLGAETSLSRVHDPGATTLAIYGLDVSANVMTLVFEGPFVAHAPGETPIWRLRIGGDAMDVNGNTMGSDFDFYFTY